MEDEKEKKLLKRKMPDQLSAFIILAAVTVAMIGSIIFFMKLEYDEILAASANNAKQQEVDENVVGSVDDFEKTENINSIEELQKLNEKEIEEAEKKDDKKTETVKTKNKYYIKVNYGAQVVTIYTYDSKGNYTVPVKAMLCSTGTYTPTGGVYRVPAKIRWCRMIGDVYGQYCTQIVGDILFHSVPYAVKGDHSSLFTEKYDQLGLRVSLGCIRLTCADAKWIYDNCKIGTQVEFYSSSNPGPLGKPSTRKISNAPEYLRGWDPTDPVANNPWKKYLANQGNKDEKPNPELNETITNTVVNDTIINDTIINDTVINDTIINDTVVNDVIVNEVIPDPTVNDIITNEIEDDNGEEGLDTNTTITNSLDEL